MCEVVVCLGCGLLGGVWLRSFLVEVLPEFVLYEVSDEDSVAVFVYGVHDGVG